MDARISLGLICFLVLGMSSWAFPLMIPSSNPVSLSADMKFVSIAGLVIMWTLMSSVLLLFAWRGIRRATRILSELEAIAEEPQPSLRCFFSGLKLFGKDVLDGAKHGATLAGATGTARPRRTRST
jgi:hypothetical protein